MYIENPRPFPFYPSSGHRLNLLASRGGDIVFKTNMRHGCIFLEGQGCLQLHVPVINIKVLLGGSFFLTLFKVARFNL